MNLQFPTEIFLKQIEEGKVYYFSNTTLLNTDVPHYFVVVKKEDEYLLLTCCTTKWNTVYKFVESRRLPGATLVTIPMGATDFLPEESHINCNDVKSIDIESFAWMNLNNSIEFKGELPPEYFHQVLIGIHSSPLVERNYKRLLQQPDDYLESKGI